jgi:hypothetical protein
MAAKHGQPGEAAAGTSRPWDFLMRAMGFGPLRQPEFQQPETIVTPWCAGTLPPCVGGMQAAVGRLTQNSLNVVITLQQSGESRRALPVRRAVPATLAGGARKKMPPGGLAPESPGRGRAAAAKKKAAPEGGLLDALPGICPGVAALRNGP